MKAIVKRILCSALALTFTGTLALEQALRNNQNGNVSLGESQAEANVSFTDVTGEFDTTALRQTNFNSKVLEADNTPTYETRSVIVQLTGEALADGAKESTVAAYTDGWAGQRHAEKLEKEQDAFLRTLSKSGIPYKLEHRYDVVMNGVSIEVNTKYVSQIKKLSGVKRVVISTTYLAPETTEAEEVVENITSVYKTGIYDSTAYTDGTKGNYDEGTVVAILDTGLDYTHNAYHTTPKNPSWNLGTVEKLFKDNTLKAEDRTSGLSAKDVYVSDKVPFAYDYADDDADVYPSYSNHGTHVAGIIGGYDKNGYTDKDGNAISETFRGVLPDSQLVICKVFTDDLDDEDLGGAISTDIIAALDDCVTLGVDVINMSLGTSCGFTTTNDGDEEGDLLDEVYDKIQEKGISLVCAASNDYSSGYGGVFGTNKISNPDSGTVGSPSTFASALSVASISGQRSPYMRSANEKQEKTVYAFYEEARDENSKEYDFASQILGEAEDAKDQTLEYVVVPGWGRGADYTTKTMELVKGKIALVERGKNTFQEKVEEAMKYGAAGIIVYNNVAGIIRMNLGEIDNPIPAVSIDMDAGVALRDTNGDGKRDNDTIGKLILSKNTDAGPFMSEFSSWGPTHDLRLKPEITAHGGEITSTVPGGYGEQSGTSMASPNMAGVMAIIRQYIKANAEKLGVDASKPTEINRLANQLIMSTATMVKDQAGRPYSPRKQGAGLGSLDNVVETNAYLSTNNAENDYRPKLELFDDAEKTGIYENMAFSVTNFGTSDLVFNTNAVVFTETIAKDGIAVAEQANPLSPALEWKIGDKAVENGKITVKKGESVTLSVTITLSDADKEKLEKFPNGMYVEGFLQLKSESKGQCDLSLPFLGFYGDWEKATMLDVTAYEVAASEKDVSIEDDQKLKAQVWATQPFTSYYNEKYILPMGGYVYLLDENDVQMYANEEYNAVSRYNEYYGEENTDNYMTSTQIKSVYTGLLRNARLMEYVVYNEDTGEEVYASDRWRIGKAYAGGGSAVPANGELELSPEELGMFGNGKYRIDVKYYMNDPDDYTLIWDGTENPEITDYNNAVGTYSFTFTVDYEAPIMQDARIRYYEYKDGNKTKQKIFLDVDVFDNHYAQALMLCYITQDAQGEQILQLATDYPTPVRNANKNARTTVSIDVTDIYAEYGGRLYVQLDDYALNSCLYSINITDANIASMDKDNFTLPNEDTGITLGVYESRKIDLWHTGNAMEGNYFWESDNPSVVAVKNGELFALQSGQAVISVANGKGLTKKLTVTVTEEVKGTLTTPSLEFGVIRAWNESLVKPTSANGFTVRVKAGQEIPLTVSPDPWYHPMTGLTIKWVANNPEFVSVTDDGVATTRKEGIGSVTARIFRTLEDGSEEDTGFSATVSFVINDEFDVSNFTLTSYDGIGYNEGTEEDGILVIPTDMNIMYIGEDAFKDNNNIKRIVIPASVTEIREGAFENCTALEEVYFVSTKHRESNGKVDATIDWSDISLINAYAFYNCTALKKIDLTNVKTVTVANMAFAGCTALNEVVDMPSIGTAHHYAFQGCTSLTSIDLTGLFVTGEGVFADCTALATIKTDRFTSIGDFMFMGCTGLREKVELNSAKVGMGAFYGCTNLKGVKFANTAVEYQIADYAFYGAGSGLRFGAFAMDWTESKSVLAIGSYAFANTKLHGQTIVLPKGLQKLGTNAFDGSGVEKINVKNVLGSLELTGEAFDGLTITVEDTEEYTEKDGVIYAVKDGNPVKALLAKGSAEGEIEFPATVTEIAPYAFAGSNVTKVTFPKNAKSFTIGEGAFMQSAVEELVFNGATVLEIPAYAFSGSAIKDIDLKDTDVKKIGEFAFMETPLATCRLGNVEEIGAYAFRDCAALTGWVSIPKSVKKIGDGAFYRSAISSVGIYGSISEGMGDRVFANTRNLQTVEVGEKVENLGRYTFENTDSLVKISSNNGVEQKFYDYSLEACAGLTEIGDGFLKGNDKIAKLTLPTSVTKIGKSAFEGCESLTAINLENVEEIGDRAFYNAFTKKSVTKIDLASAKKIGNYAFALEHYIEENGKLVLVSASNHYLTLNIENAEEIGDFAFMTAGVSSVKLSDNVKKIGKGAFARAIKQVSFEFVSGKEDNGVFKLIDGVLYRYMDEAKTQYELVAYPQGRDSEKIERTDKDGNVSFEMVYTVAEGTVRIGEYVFYGMTGSRIDAVVLPHTVRLIGDAAFFESRILDYYFESIQAPKLETVYRAEIAEKFKELEDSDTAAYRGYYYANFENYIFNYTKYGKAYKYNPLKMYYPDNGVGYDNLIYKTYFGMRTKAGVQMTDNTRECLNALTMLDLEELKSWLDASFANNAENKAIVERVSEELKQIRTSYNTIIKDEAQAAFFGEELDKKLLDAEAVLRSVKDKFDIPVYIDTLEAASTSTHKQQYIEGETLDLTGLIVTVFYDDGSSVEVAWGDPRLMITSQIETLTVLHNSVDIAFDEDGDGRKDGFGALSITVMLPPAEEPEDSSVIVDIPKTVTGLGIAFMVIGGLLVAAGGVGLGLFLVNKKKMETVNTVNDNDESTAMKEDESGANESKE